MFFFPSVSKAGFFLYIENWKVVKGKLLHGLFSVDLKCFFFGPRLKRVFFLYYENFKVVKGKYMHGLFFVDLKCFFFWSVPTAGFFKCQHGPGKKGTSGEKHGPFLVFFGIFIVDRTACVLEEKPVLARTKKEGFFIVRGTDFLSSKWISFRLTHFVRARKIIRS